MAVSTLDKAGIEHAPVALAVSPWGVGQTGRRARASMRDLYPEPSEATSFLVIVVLIVLIVVLVLFLHLIISSPQHHPSLDIGL